MTSAHGPAPDIRFARLHELDAATLYDLLKLRFNVFVLEQRSLYPDIDGRDPEAVHLLAEDDGVIVGGLRILAPETGGPIVLGRVVVSADHRGKGLGGRMLKATLAWAANAAAGRAIRLSAQIDQRAFYARHGFSVVSDPYDDGGIPHVDMRRGPA